MTDRRPSTRRRRLAAAVLAATTSLNAASNLSAQTPVAAPQALRRPTAADVSGFIDRGDIAGAVDALRRASAGSITDPSARRALEASRSRLIQIGIDAELLSLPPAAFKRLPEVHGSIPLTPAGPSTTPAGPSTTPAGPSTTQVGSPTTKPMPVTPAMWAGGDGGVVQAGLQSGTDANTPAGGEVAPVQFVDATPTTTPPATTPTGGLESLPPGSGAMGGDAEPIAPLPSVGTEAFDRGMRALTSGDKAAARAAFLEAWQDRDQLDVATQNMLKDKLTLLQPRRLGNRRSGDPAATAAAMTPLEKAKLETQTATRDLYRSVTSQLAAIEKVKTTDPIGAQDSLAVLQAKVAAADIDPAARKALAVMVDRAVVAQKQYVENNRAKIELDLENEAVRTSMELDDARRAQIDEEVSAMVDEYNDLMAQRRYQEATVVARQVVALKPNDPIGETMFHNSRIKTRLEIATDIRNDKENSFIENLADVERSSVGIDPNLAIQFNDPQSWASLSKARLANDDNDLNLSVAEREIKSKLTTAVNVRYTNRSLAEVIDDLSVVTGVPMVIDQAALSAIRVDPNTPVTLNINQPVQLKSALNLLLEGKDLTFIIRNDVLMITSNEVKDSDLITKTYKVTDLVTPIPNFVSGYEDGLAGALRAAYQMTMPQADVHLMPMSMTDMAAGGMASANNPMNPVGTGQALGQYHPMGGQGGFGSGAGGFSSSGQGAGGAAFADFQSLIQLIETTIEPDTWESLGGNSTMSEYAQNLSLVISTTSDVHDQITDLLESLRRLQNLQITIEVRFITLSDAFAEQIGVDFDLQFDDNLTEFPGDDNGPSVSVGINADNSFTSNLDITVDQNLGTLAPFGPSTSPTTLGFAILSDIEAFFFLQAAQVDNRSNVMQAPKVTLFDGQLATIADQSQRPFVTSITPVVGDFAVAQQPVIVVLNEGTQLNVQGVVSNDKRFVRLTLVPFFSQIGAVDTFTFQGRSSSNRSSTNQEDTNGDGVVNDDDAIDSENEQDIIEGTTVQLPTFAFTTVSTTVSVPDGGTILLGGIKRLSEGRNETGVPILSKIPYVNRLFRNQAMGRTASSLMLMVTPRIIIQEEEELAQTGFDANRR